jgi:hypothetical protein
MGGLVVKLAYILSRQSEQYSHLRANLHGVLFLATPHRGSPLAVTLSRIFDVMLRKSNPFVRDLVPGSEATEFINEHFLQYSESFQMYSFYETRPTSWPGGRGFIIVSKTSAVLGYPREHTSPLDTDHSNMCKFESRDSPNYRLVRDTLSGLVSTAGASDGTAS